MSDPNSENKPRVEIIPPGGGFGRDAGRQSFLQGYLRKAGKLMAFIAIIGCCFMLFAAYMIASTFQNILSKVSEPLPTTSTGR